MSLTRHSFDVVWEWKAMSSRTERRPSFTTAYVSRASVEVGRHPSLVTQRDLLVRHLETYMFGRSGNQASVDSRQICRRVV